MQSTYVYTHIHYSKAVQGNWIAPILSRNLLFTFCSIIDLVQSRQIYFAVSVYIYVHMYDITLLEVETFSSAYSCMWQRRKRKKKYVESLSCKWAIRKSFTRWYVPQLPQQSTSLKKNAVLICTLMSNTDLKEWGERKTSQFCNINSVWTGGELFVNTCVLIHIISILICNAEGSSVGRKTSYFYLLVCS